MAVMHGSHACRLKAEKNPERGGTRWAKYMYVVNNMADRNGGSRVVPSGYDYDFVSLIDEDYICQICQLPLKQAVLTRCGHRFCHDCLKESFRR